MESRTVNFIYKRDSLKILCQRNENMKDIIKKFSIKYNEEIKDAYYLYKDTIVNQELKLEQINNNDNEINILVVSSEINKEDIETLILLILKFFHRLCSSFYITYSFW